MKTMRRVFVLLLALVTALLAACGGNGKPETTAKPGKPEQTANPGGEAQATEEPQATDEPEKAAITPEELWSRELVFETVLPDLPEGTQLRGVSPNGLWEVYSIDGIGYVKDALTGEMKPIALTPIAGMESEQQLRMTLLSRPGGSNIDREAVGFWHGMDLLKNGLSSTSTTQLPIQSTGTDPRFIFVQINGGGSGMLDTQTGELFAWYSGIGDIRSPWACSAGTDGRLLLSSAPDTIGILDIDTQQIEKINVLDLVDIEHGAENSLISVRLAAFLSDGSICVVISDRYMKREGDRGENCETCYLAVLGEKTELYRLSGNGNQIYGIVSNDPNYVLISFNSNRTLRLVDRRSGAVSVLTCENDTVEAVPFDEDSDKFNEKLTVFGMLDDSETLLLQDSDGVIRMFRPDTLESRVVPVADPAYSGRWTPLFGDSRGHFTFRDMDGMRNVNLVLTDKNSPGEPIFPEAERFPYTPPETPDMTPSGEGRTRDSYWKCDYFEMPGFARGFEAEKQGYGVIAIMREVIEDGVIYTELRLVSNLYGDIDDEALLITSGAEPGTWENAEDGAPVKGWFTKDGMVINGLGDTLFHFVEVDKAEADAYARNVMHADPENGYEEIE